MIFLICVTVLCLAVAYYLQKHNLFRIWYFGRRIPGPPGWPIIGNALSFVNKSAEESFANLNKALAGYSGLCRIWLGLDFNVFFTDPADLEVLLSSSQYITKSDAYKYFRPWLCQGLLLSEGRKWFQRRKIITPAFHFKNLEQYIEIFDRQSDIMIKKLSKFPTEDPIDILPVIALCTLDVICETAMGVALNAQLKSDSEYVVAVEEVSNAIHARVVDVVLRVDLFFRFSQLYRKMTKALKVVNSFTDSLILERRAKLIRDADNMNNNKKRKLDFLDILLQSEIDGHPLSNLDIREEVNTFMFGGHDTSSTAITFCLYCIAKNPTVQQKCFEEIQNLLGDNFTGKITLQDLNGLSYLDLVIKEALRMYPPAPIIARKITKETTINGTTLAEGTTVAVSIYSMGRDPKLFVDPNEFRPERFLETHVSPTKNPFAYIPFSAGPRNCVGQKYAILELKCFLSKVLRHFELRLPDDCLNKEPTLKVVIILESDPINMYLRPRRSV